MKEFRPLQIDWNEIYSGGQRKKVLKQWSLHERQFNRNHVKVIPKGVTLTINVKFTEIIDMTLGTMSSW